MWKIFFEKKVRKGVNFLQIWSKFVNIKEEKQITYLLQFKTTELGIKKLNTMYSIFLDRQNLTNWIVV